MKSWERRRLDWDIRARAGRASRRKRQSQTPNAVPMAGLGLGAPIGLRCVCHQSLNCNRPCRQSAAVTPAPVRASPCAGLCAFWQPSALASQPAVSAFELPCPLLPDGVRAPAATSQRPRRRRPTRPASIDAAGYLASDLARPLRVAPSATAPPTLSPSVAPFRTRCPCSPPGHFSPASHRDARACLAEEPSLAARARLLTWLSQLPQAPRGPPPRPWHLPARLGTQIPSRTPRSRHDALCPPFATPAPV